MSFWRGMLALRPEDLTYSYALLGKTSPNQVFPIKFESEVPIAGGPVAGEVPGFLVLQDFKTMRTKVVA